MKEELDYYEFDKRIAVLEERMETQLAKNESAIDRLRADMEKRDKEALQRDKEALQRDKDNQRWIVGFGVAQLVIIIAIIAAGFAFLGILIGLPD